MKQIVVVVALLFALGALAQTAPAGPPQFITFPILTRVAEQGLDHGHFVFGGEAAIPSPLFRDQGAAAFNPAAFGPGALLAGTDSNVSNTSDSYEGETGAAGTSGALVGASNHIYPGNCNTNAASNTFGDCAVQAYTLTSGVTFSKTTISRTWGGTTFGITFDPALDYDKDGNFYFSFGGAPLGGSYPNSIAVSQSADGINWGTPVAVTFNKGKAFDDKYYIAIDRSNSTFANRIYVSWDRNQGNNQILYIAYSQDRGATWSAPIKVDDGKTKFERVIGAYPAVDHRNGTVYDSWHNYAKNIIYVDKSTNGGVAWGRDVAAATTHAGFGQNIGCVGGRSQGPAHALKVGPSGALYLVYADPVTSGQNSRKFDILFTKSTNSGASWSTPVVLNDDNTATDQFHPTLSVNPLLNSSGKDTITVTFYDRRDDPSNCLAHVYATQSTDSGANWSANVRLTSNQSNFDGNPNGPGDYSSSTPFGGSVWPFFSEHPPGASVGAFDIYTAEVR